MTLAYNRHSQSICTMKDWYSARMWLVSHGGQGVKDRRQATRQGCLLSEAVMTGILQHQSQLAFHWEPQGPGSFTRWGEGALGSQLRDLDLHQRKKNTLRRTEFFVSCAEEKTRTEPSLQYFWCEPSKPKPKSCPAFEPWGQSSRIQRGQ